MPRSDCSMLKKLSKKPHRWKSHAEQDVKQQSGFHYEEIWRINLHELYPLDYYIWENIWGQSQVSSKTEDIAELEEMLQMTV